MAPQNTGGEAYAYKYSHSFLTCKEVTITSFMSQILTTTTNNIEGWSIKEYYQPISSNIVIGANIFSDFSASITDFFGGRSSSYENKLQAIYKQATEKLKASAKSIGANSIIGFSIDVDEISGGGKQMFMITAFGTPVYAVKNGTQDDKAEATAIVDGPLVDRKLKANALLKDFENGKGVLNENTVNFILESKLPELSKLVLSFINCGYESERGLVDQVSRYFDLVDIDIAKDTLYKGFKPGLNNFFYTRTINLLKEYNLIDYKRVIGLIESEDLSVAKHALNIVVLPKQSYSNTDLEYLRSITTAIQNRFKPLGENTTKKKLLSSTELPAWKCKCGKVNDDEDQYCRDCSKDIYGFLSEEIKPKKVIILVNSRVDIIQTLLREK